MANYTAADVKKLRDLTGAGMMDCKKALDSSDGDFDKAVEFLRIKGAKDVGKRAGRTAANGIVAHSGNALLELNCETDFVAKTPDFVALGQQLVEHGEQHKIADAAALSSSTLPDGRTVADVVQDFSAKIGEKIVVNRYAELDGNVAVYLHARRRTAAAGGRPCRVHRKTTRPATPTPCVGMQIAAMRPKFPPRRRARRDGESERRIASTRSRGGQARAGLPKILDGRVTPSSGLVSSISRR